MSRTITLHCDLCGRLYEPHWFDGFKGIECLDISISKPVTIEGQVRPFKMDIRDLCKPCGEELEDLLWNLKDHRAKNCN